MNPVTTTGSQTRASITTDDPVRNPALAPVVPEQTPAERPLPAQVADLLGACPLQTDQFVPLPGSGMVLARHASGGLVIQPAEHAAYSPSLNGLLLAPQGDGFTARIDGRPVAPDSAALSAWQPHIAAALEQSRALAAQARQQTERGKLERLTKFFGRDRSTQPDEATAAGQGHPLRDRLAAILAGQVDLTLAQLDGLIREMGWRLTPEQQKQAAEQREAAKRLHNPKVPPPRAFTRKDVAEGGEPRALNLDNPSDRQTYLEQLSPPPAPNAPFPGAVVQDNSLKVANLEKLMTGYAALLRQSAPGDAAVEQAAQHLEQFRQRLDDLLRGNYKHFGRKLLFDAQSRYPTPTEIAFLGADTFRHVDDILTSARKGRPLPTDPAAHHFATRQLSTLAHHTTDRLRPRELPAPSQAGLYDALARNARQLKHNLVTAAVDTLVYDRAQYLGHNRRSGPRNQDVVALRPGSEAVTRDGSTFSIGYGGAIGVAEGTATLTLGTRTFLQAQTGRDGQPAHSGNHEVLTRVKLDVKFGVKGASPTFTAQVDGEVSTGPGVAVKSKTPDDIEQIGTTLDILARSGAHDHRSLDGSARSVHSTVTQAANLVRRFVTGTPIQPPLLPNAIITQDRYMAGRNNHGQIQAGGKALDGLTPPAATAIAQDASAPTFETLLASHFPGVHQRFEAQASGAPAKLLDTSAAPPFSYSGQATAVRATTKLANKRHTDNSTVKGGATVSAALMPFNKESGEDQPGVFPSAGLTIEASRRHQTNNRMKYSGNLDLFGPENKLTRDAMDSAVKTRAAYEGWTAPAGATANPCLQFMNEHGVPDLLANGTPAPGAGPTPEEVAVLGDAMPDAIRRNLDGMRSGALAPVEVVQAVSGRARALSTAYEALYEAGTMAYHADQPAERKAAFEQLNATYLQGWYTFPSRPGDADYRNFLTVVKNNFDNTALELACCMSAVRLVGAYVLADAAQEARDEFTAALKSQAKAYDAMKQRSENNLLPLHAFQQKVGDKSSSSVSSKDDVKISTTVSVHPGFLSGPTKIDNVVPADKLGEPLNTFVSASFRRQDQEAHINALRLATADQYAIELGAARAVHQPVMHVLRALRRDIMKKEGTAASAADLLPEHLTFPALAPLVYGTENHVYAVNYVTPKGAPTDAAGTFFEGKKALRSLASSMYMTGTKSEIRLPLGGKLLAPLMHGIKLGAQYTQSSSVRNPEAAKFGPSAGDLALIKDRYGHAMVDKNNQLLTGDEMTAAFNQEEMLYFRNALFCGLNPIYRTVHLGKVAFDRTQTEPRDYYTEFDVVLHGMGDVGDNIRKQLQASKAIAPNASADPFQRVQGDFFDGIRSKATQWERFDPQLDDQLRTMSPQEQLAFYAHDPRGRAIAQAFMDLMKTLNTFNDAYKLKDGGGYTTVVRDEYVKALPMHDPAVPRSTARRAADHVKNAVRHPATTEPGAVRSWDMDQSPPTTTLDWSQLHKPAPAALALETAPVQPAPQDTLIKRVVLHRTRQDTRPDTPSSDAQAPFTPSTPREAGTTLYATVTQGPDGRLVQYNDGRSPAAEPARLTDPAADSPGTVTHF